MSNLRIAVLVVSSRMITGQELVGVSIAGSLPRVTG